MKLKVNKNDILYNIGLVSRAAVNKSTMNILECILITADENGIKLTANNLDMGIESKYFDADIEDYGKAAIEGRFLTDVIRSAPSQDIYMETDDKFITTIKSGRYEIKVPGRNPEVFPALPEVAEDIPYVFQASKFREMIRKTIFAVAVENIKPVLTGEYIEINDNNLNMVGIDGYRIACANSEILKGNGDEFSVIVPGSAMNEISRLITDEEEISLFFTDTHMLIRFKDCVMLTNLIEGEYLKYKQFFTDDFKTKVTLKKDEMLSCLDRVLLISKDAKKSPVKVVISEGAIELSSISETLGSMYEKIDCDVNGDDLTIGFNPKYLQDIFKNIDSEEVNLMFNSPLSPCVVDGGNEEYKYLILPLRL